MGNPEIVKRIAIENIRPNVDAGRYPVKCEVGDSFFVQADVFRDGHEKIVVRLLNRVRGENSWKRNSMVCLNSGLDLWEGSFIAEELGFSEYSIEAFCDLFASWAADTRKKLDAGQNVLSDLEDGLALGKRYLSWVQKDSKPRLKELLRTAETLKGQAEKAAILLGRELLEITYENPDPETQVLYDKPLLLWVDRLAARYSAWYELFPRSQGKDPKKSGTFKDVEARLPQIEKMGFDVLYFPPIHPIGITKRKGPNNSLKCSSSDPGCPYSIGSSEGGHDAIEPGLGNFKDFDRLVNKARQHGLEIALDFALNCSPDHPYLKEHPEWFCYRSDGTIKFAENPPKKYEDIYPLNFETSDKEGLWNELKRVLLFWAKKGVRIFRVDNPHTKPFCFWEWIIREIQNEFPDVLFLAEAFTRPRVMQHLAKIGFSQSYSYFTWRNFKQELTEYFSELTKPPISHYFRANLFANTPDILPTFLQRGGRPAFKIRATLSATLSSVYGIYSGFELCENAALLGKEEYFNSEKYEIKPRDWNEPGNIIEYISLLNRIRKENPAFQEYDNLKFYQSENEHILFYGKSLGDNHLLVAVSLDPFQKQHSFVHVPIELLSLKPDDTYQVHDLITDRRYLWKGAKNYVELDPYGEIANIFILRRWSHREQDFDYYK
ncbi:MAG: alpha-1,4-glucan--maltose-1-phosphate maltosyltransferase [Candidatus Riflebacteria bacterium]|nr:alpha-1,4-glucan--maltose-1-phosphate maltosyltransferase [Candidatus Riflebacteria bacterium]